MNAISMKWAVATAAVLLVLAGLWHARSKPGQTHPESVASTTATAPAADNPTVRPREPRPVTVVVAGSLEPSACLERLVGLSFTNDSSRGRSMRTVIQQLENLVDIGPAAVPAIRAFLLSHPDAAFSGRSEGLAPASLRTGLYDVLKRIGGSESEATLVEMLSQCQSGNELRHLSRLVEEIAPGTYKDRIVAAARALAASASSLTGQAARRELENAYELLGRAGDSSLVAKAQSELITSSGKLDENALRYLSRTLGNQSLPLIQQALADPRLKDGESREELVEAIRDRMEKNPEAMKALQQIATDSSLGRRERDAAFEALARAGDLSLADVAKHRLVTEDGKVNESALRYLERAVGDNVLPEVIQAWGDPRVQSNEEREELVQTIVSRVGRNTDATMLWQEIAANPQMPRNLREEAIGELDDRGINRRRPTEQDVQLAQTRMQLLEQLSPNLQDPELVNRANRVYRELSQVVQRPPSPTGRPK